RTSRSEPALQRASRRTHKSLSTISFNLAETAPTPPGQNPLSVGDRTPDTVYTSASQATLDPAETAETLRAHKQLNGVLFPSARAIQPFKPALPFSAQTLRLAKQKALAMSQSRA
ncbi:MAG: hypothetical protein AAFY72_16780, partial [Cyanobacteria bacterium J06649_4]